MPSGTDRSALRVRMRDPLAEFLGSVPAGNVIDYSLDGLVPLTGHLCPTVTGAFLAARAGVAALYPDGVGVRGEISVDVMGGVTDGSNGPISQVLTYVTGAAAENGFAGLGGKYRRRGLLHFHPDTLKPWQFVFRRLDNGTGVVVSVRLDRVPLSPEMGTMMHGAMEGDPGSLPRFQELWRQRIDEIVRRELSEPGSIAGIEPGGGQAMAAATP